jgi:hypothetical protein
MALLITPADSAFSKCVRERANWTCERCGRETPLDKRMGLHCSHYIGRGNWSVRFHPLNAVAHCYGCHQYLGSRPNEFSDWMVEKVGLATTAELLRLSKQPARGLRKQVATIAKHYRNEHKRQELERKAGAMGRLEFDLSPICPDITIIDWREAMGDA